MGPFKHLVASTALAAVSYAFDKDAAGALSCIASGTLVDADHLIEYALYCKDFDVEWDWNEFASGKYFDRKKTVKVLFHSWEFAIVLWTCCLFTHFRNGVLRGITLGYTLHLLMDFFGNNLVDAGYFWLYRCKKNWVQDELTVQEASRK